jgi:lipopolysaccharide/colanic/teichoic acid biosynthesis glycosyltransferase
MSEVVVPSAGDAARPLAWATTDELLRAGLSLALALFAFVFLLPLLILVAAAIYAEDGGPVLFAHRRIGRNGRAFRCLKFRTMAVDADQRLAQLLRNDLIARAEWERDQKLRHDPRVTRLGAILRRTSLDELPQLINVLRGEMGLVGPRPIVESEVPKYGHRFHHYCRVKPGITGLWQVSGRNDTGYRTRVALDCVYAQRRSLILDVYILAATVPAVLLCRGSY